MRAKIRESLTEAQRARLRILDDVVKLLPIYSEAVNVNLVETPAGFGPSPRLGSGVIIGGVFGLEQEKEPQ